MPDEQLLGLCRGIEVCLVNLKPSVYELEVHKSVHIVTCVKNFKMVLFLEIKSYCYECL